MAQIYAALARPEDTPKSDTKIPEVGRKTINDGQQVIEFNSRQYSLDSQRYKLQMLDTVRRLVQVPKFEHEHLNYCPIVDIIVNISNSNTNTDQVNNQLNQVNTNQLNHNNLNMGKKLMDSVWSLIVNRFTNGYYFHLLLLSSPSDIGRVTKNSSNDNDKNASTTSFYVPWELAKKHKFSELLNLDCSEFENQAQTCHAQSKNTKRAVVIVSNRDIKPEHVDVIVLHTNNHHLHPDVNSTTMSTTSNSNSTLNSTPITTIVHLMAVGTKSLSSGIQEKNNDNCLWKMYTALKQYPTSRIGSYVYCHVSAEHIAIDVICRTVAVDFKPGSNCIPFQQFWFNVGQNDVSIVKFNTAKKILLGCVQYKLFELQTKIPINCGIFKNDPVIPTQVLYLYLHLIRDLVTSLYALFINFRTDGVSTVTTNSANIGNIDTKTIITTVDEFAQLFKLSPILVKHANLLLATVYKMLDKTKDVFAQWPVVLFEDIVTAYQECVMRSPNNNLHSNMNFDKSFDKNTETELDMQQYNDFLFNNDIGVAQLQELFAKSTECHSLTYSGSQFKTMQQVKKNHDNKRHIMVAARSQFATEHSYYSISKTMSTQYPGTAVVCQTAIVPMIPVLKFNDDIKINPSNRNSNDMMSFCGFAQFQKAKESKFSLESQHGLHPNPGLESKKTSDEKESKIGNGKLVDSHCRSVLRRWLCNVAGQFRHANIEPIDPNNILAVFCLYSRICLQLTVSENQYASLFRHYCRILLDTVVPFIKMPNGTITACTTDTRAQANITLRDYIQSNCLSVDHFETFVCVDSKTHASSSRGSKNNNDIVKMSFLIIDTYLRRAAITLEYNVSDVRFDVLWYFMICSIDDTRLIKNQRWLKDSICEKVFNSETVCSFKLKDDCLLLYPHVNLL